MNQNGFQLSGNLIIFCSESFVWRYRAEHFCRSLISTRLLSDELNLSEIRFQVVETDNGHGIGTCFLQWSSPYPLQVALWP